MFHMNIKGLPKHFDELQQYLNMLEYDFSVIGISEHGWMRITPIYMILMAM